MNLIGGPSTANLRLTHASSTPSFAFTSPSGGHMSLLRWASQPKTVSYRIDEYEWQRNKHCWTQRICCAVTESIAEEKKTTETSMLPRTRRLILLRHAKSSWADPSLRDHDRPLSKYGRLAAASISGKLYQMGWLPELILSSDANRTRQTLQIMQEQVRDFSEAEVHFIPSFYSVAAMDGQTAQHLQQAVCQYSRDDILTIMCMGHNRGWEEAASMFSGVPVELKTSNAAVLEALGKSWEELWRVCWSGVGDREWILKSALGHWWFGGINTSIQLPSLFPCEPLWTKSHKLVSFLKLLSVQAFYSAGFGGWKLIGIIKPD